MTDFYDDLAQTALDLIAEFGRDVQHAPVGTVENVPGEPWRGRSPAPASTIKAAVFDATAQDRQVFPNLEFSKRALVAAQGLINIPAPEDRVIDDRNYRVVRVVETGPGPVPLLYTLLLSASAS